jgi:hypothetical protein
MQVNAKDILKRLKKEDRIRRSFYISESIYDDFQRACGDVAVSQVVEELMRQFVESAKDKKSPK